MKTTTRTFYEAAVHRAIAEVIDGLDAALDLGALARVACLSPFHFHRVFKGMIGETPLELHRRLRMERAAATLLRTAAPVVTVAFDAGYETHESFTRAFARYYGCSPSALRARPPATLELPTRSGLHFANTRDGRFTLIALRGAPMNVTIEDRRTVRVATVRHVGAYQDIGSAFETLGAIAGPAGLFGPGAQTVAIYYDDPETTPVDQLRADAGVVVDEGVVVPEALGATRLAGGPYATTTHAGSYAGLGETWNRLMGEWLPASGRRVADQVAYEVYRNTPMDVPEDQLRTDLYVPLV